MNKLRKKFILAVFVSAAVVFALTAFFMFLGVKYSNAAREDSMTELILTSGGEFAAFMKPGDGRNRLFSFGYNEESPYRLRYFTVGFENGLPKDADVSHIASVGADEALSVASSVTAGFRQKGYVGEFRFRFSEDRSTAVFLDCSDDIDTLRNLVSLICLISFTFVVLITVVFGFLSKRVMRPFEENARQQKRFITDASHELKTPLAIISANAEVLEYKFGENEWTGNITAQVEKTSGLINELLTLNRLEEIETNSKTEPVDISPIARETAGEFSEVFASRGVTVTESIDESAVVQGNKEQLTRLLSVLVDNAAKYVTENGRFDIKVEKLPRSVRITAFNTCETDKDADYSELFSRFYRSDKSRNSLTGGHGVGLSIAKRITDLHNGSISAVPRDGGLEFKVTIPRKK